MARGQAVVRELEYHKDSHLYKYRTNDLDTSQASSLCPVGFHATRVYQKVSGLAALSENCKLYSSLPLGAVVSLFCESV